MAAIKQPFMYSAMFRRLRIRMTLLNAGTTIVLLLLLRILTAVWLSAAFNDVADAALAARLSQTLISNHLPIPADLQTFAELQTPPGATADTPIDVMRDHPTIVFGVADLAASTGTYVYLIDAAGNQVAATTPQPFPVAYTSLLAAAADESRNDTRTITDDTGANYRVRSYILNDPRIDSIQVGRPMADYDALESRLRTIIMWGGVAGIVVVAATAWYLSGIFMRPTADAYERQRRFISNASHELRTPLSIVRASAQLARLDTPPGNTVAELLDSIIAENRHMTDTIDNLLTIARTQDRIPTVSSYDIRSLLRDTTQAALRIAPHRSIAYIPDANPLSSTADPHYVSHIVRILLDNAIAHTPNDALITVTAVPLTASLEIWVADSGNGVPSEHVATIFEPFVTYSRGTGHRGSGIGLNIATTFATALGASLRYEPNQPRGACFVLTLPV